MSDLSLLFSLLLQSSSELLLLELSSVPVLIEFVAPPQDVIDDGLVVLVGNVEELVLVPGQRGRVSGVVEDDVLLGVRHREQRELPAPLVPCDRGALLLLMGVGRLYSLQSCVHLD